MSINKAGVIEHSILSLRMNDFVYFLVPMVSSIVQYSEHKS